MRILLAFVLLLLIPGCSGRTPPVAASCPHFPTDSSIKISGTLRSNYWMCTATSSANEQLFQIYIGANPDLSELRYGETVRSNHGYLVWFVSPRKNDLGQSSWYTFTPSGDKSMPVMVLSFTASDDADFRRRANLVADLLLGP